jgi:hypothetical protein
MITVAGGPSSSGGGHAIAHVASYEYRFNPER